MDIKELQWFLHILNCGSFSNAAQRLGVTQPTLSRAIQKLEQELGTKLLIRQPNGIQATESGAELRRRIEPILNEIQAIRSSIQDSSHHGIVRIGVTPMTSNMFLAPLITDFSKHWPDIRLTFFESGTERIRRKLLTGELDVGLGLHTFDDTQLENIPLVQDDMVVYVHESNPLAQRESLDFDALRNERLNLCDTSFGITNQIYSRCKAANFYPTINVQSSRFMFLMQLSALNNGICILPRPYCAVFAQEHTKMIPLEGYPWIEALIYDKNTFISGDTQLVMDYFQEAFQTISKELALSDDKNPLHLSCIQNWGSHQI